MNEDYVEFEIKAIKEFLGIEYTGDDTQENKENFVNKYKKERLSITTKLLSSSYEEMKQMTLDICAKKLNCNKFLGGVMKCQLNY